ncbi:MAG: cell division protein ZapA [Saprospiraceae bacterium]|nr:cell division protein ZapA [Saprospiraceae bacterium]
MAASDTRQITVLIAGRPYPLKIKADDEATIREIVKDVNEKVNQFQLTYPNRDKQDCLALVLLTYAVDLFKSGGASTQDQESLAKLSRIDQMLDQMLL